MCWFYYCFFLLFSLLFKNGFVAFGSICFRFLRLRFFWHSFVSFLSVSCTIIFIFFLSIWCACETYVQIYRSLFLASDEIRYRWTNMRVSFRRTNINTAESSCTQMIQNRPIFSYCFCYSVLRLLPEIGIISILIALYFALCFTHIWSRIDLASNRSRLFSTQMYVVYVSSK